MGVFIEVTLDRGACDLHDGCRILIQKCPVDIFREEDGRVGVNEENVDECTLCGLCWETIPDAVAVRKLY